jgi:hypothetical protein
LKIQDAPVLMDLGLLYAALKADRIDLAAANATDGRPGHREFVMLEDDRHYFPPYECAIAVRDDTLRRFPDCTLRWRSCPPHHRTSDAPHERTSRHRPQARCARGARIPRYVEASAWK